MLLPLSVGGVALACQIVGLIPIWSCPSGSTAIVVDIVCPAEVIDSALPSTWKRAELVFVRVEVARSRGIAVVCCLSGSAVRYCRN